MSNDVGDLRGILLLNYETLATMYASRGMPPAFTAGAADAVMADLLSQQHYAVAPDPTAIAALRPVSVAGELRVGVASPPLPTPPTTQPSRPTPQTQQPPSQPTPQPTPQPPQPPQPQHAWKLRVASRLESGPQRRTANKRLVPTGFTLTSLTTPAL